MLENKIVPNNQKIRNKIIRITLYKNFYIQLTTRRKSGNNKLKS